MTVCADGVGLGRVENLLLRTGDLEAAVLLTGIQPAVDRLTSGGALCLSGHEISSPSGAGFENEIEWSLRPAAESREAAVADHGAQPPLARLGAQTQPDFLRARGRRADERRGRIEDAADGIQVFL